MKSILLSVKPQYVEKILNGEKIAELRKSVPKGLPPYKVYIYCTKGKNNWLRKYPFSNKYVFYQLCDDAFNALNGKIVGEFVVNVYDKFKSNDWFTVNHLNKGTCITNEEILQYGKGKFVYSLHIDNLKVYSKPKELSEFYTVCTIDANEIGCRNCPNNNKEHLFCNNRKKPLIKPPQSWCYVEKI